MIFKTITDETTLFGQRIVGVLQARKIAQQQATAQLEIDIACLKEYQVTCQNGTVTTEQFNTIMHKASASAVEYSAKIKAGTGTTQSYANAQRTTNSALQDVSIGAGIASKAVKLFSAALNMVTFTAIIQGVSWLIGGINECIVTAKEAKESANAFKDSLSTFFNEAQSNLKTISSLSDRFDELSKNVDDNGKKIGGTEEEYAEFLNICQQVGQIMPNLITGYSKEGEAIVTLQGKVNSLTESYKKAIQEKASLFILNGDEEGNTINSFFKDYNNFINGYHGVWGLKKAPSTIQFKSASFEEYYGYDTIHKWLSYVKDMTFEELSNLHTGGAVWGVYINRVLKEANYDINNITEENYNAIHDVLSDKFTVMEKELSDRDLNIRSAFQNMLYADNDYWNIDDENVIAAINSLYSSIDAEFIKQNGLFNQNTLQTFVSNFISLFNNADVKQAIIDFYTPIADDEPVKNYIEKVRSALKTLQTYCKENGIEIPIDIFDNNTVDINRRLKNSIRKLTDDHGMTDRESYTYLVEEVDFDNFTLQQAELWLKATQGAENAKQAVEMYKAELDKAAKADNQLLSLSETIDQLNTKIKPAFDSLESAWKDIFTEDGFALSSIDILSTCDSIKSKLDALNNIDGITVDYSSYEDFVRVLRNSESTEKEVQDAFDALAASITQAGLSGAEDFETMKAALEDLGVANSEIVAFDALISNTWALKEAGLDLANATEEEITGFVNEKVSAENAAQAIKMLIFQKELCNLQEMNSVREVAHLRTLAKNAGYTGEAIQYLTELTLIYSRVARGYYGTEGQLLDDALVHANELKQLITESSFQVDFDVEKESAGPAGKDAAKSFTDALDKELTALDKKMEAGYIDFNDYIQARLALIEAYYKQGKLSADEYYSYLEKHYDTQLSYMDKVVSAVTRRIDTEIDALKQQKEDVESLYKVQIESLEKQKTLLEEANQERQRQIDLQKSLYDLERARNQRTKLVYSEDKGMHYVADDQSIRDAQKSADDAKYENQIAEIEKSISKLENARDQETSAIDAMISNLEEYKDAWSDVTSAYKEEQEDLIAAQFFGADWESKVLNGRLEILNDFKEQYIRIQQEIAAAAAQESVNEQVSGSKDDQKKQKKALDILKTPIQRLVSSLASSLTSSLSAQNQGILSHIQTYGSGTNNARKGLNLVGEDGAEAYFDNHGHVAIVTKPTLIPMEGGEVVKNERDTKGLLDPDNLAPADTIALADIDGKEARYTIKVDVEAETFTLSDGTVLTPLQPEGRMFELQQKFDAYMESIAHNVDMLSADIAREHSRQMQEITNPMTNSSTVNNRNVQPVMNQNITLNCPNVTNNSGIEYIRKELGHLSLRAMQESMK